jgi:MFS superfamily sulfate permease-like transporter
VALVALFASHLMKVGEMRRFHQLVPPRVLAGHADPGWRDRPGRPARPDPRRGRGTGAADLPGQPALVSLLGADPATPGAFEDIRRHRQAAPVPGTLIARPDAPLFYANAQLVRETIERAVVSSPGPVRASVLILDANDDLDITSADQLEKLTGTLHATNVPLGIAHMHGPALQMAQRSGLLAKIGPDHIFPTTPAAVAWARSASDCPGR